MTETQAPTSEASDHDSRKECEPETPETNETAMVDEGSDSDSERNPAMPERVQWEFHDKSWWRGCWRQQDLEAAWKAWHRHGCPSSEIFHMEYKNINYHFNFKKMMQSSHEKCLDGTLKPSRKMRSLRRIIVTHERDSKRPYM